MQSTLIDQHSLVTIKQFFDYAKNCFSAFEDSYDAKVDAQALLCAALDKPVSHLLTWPERVLSAEQARIFIDFVERRQQGEPVAFITGKREFWSLDFLVAPCTLIPRPDTEILVEAVLDNNQNNSEHSEQTRLLDLGTGTGAIALALASELTNWQVEAVDFNEKAVALAKTNAQQLDLSRVSIYQSDWFANIDAHKKFKVIVSNPPYIDANDEHLSQGDVRFEPLSALVADDNGYADIIQIIKTARQFLTCQGQLYLEHGFEQHQTVQKLLNEFGYTQVTTFNDYGGNPRITMGTYTKSR